MGILFTYFYIDIAEYEIFFAITEYISIIRNNYFIL